MKQFSVNVCYEISLPVVVTADDKFEAISKARAIAEKAQLDEFEYDSSDAWITAKEDSIWARLKSLGWNIQKAETDTSGNAVVIDDDPDNYREGELHACLDTIKDNGLIAFVTPLDDSKGSEVFLSITDERKDSFCIYESQYNLKDTEPSEIDSDYRSAVRAYLDDTVKQKSDEIECFIHGSKDCPQRIKDLWDDLKKNIVTRGTI